MKQHKPLIIVAILSLAAVVLVSCNTTPDRSTPSGAMIGHWKEIDAQASADNPGYEGSTQRSPIELYISTNAVWSVKQGATPLKVTYEVLEQNPQDFSLKQLVTTLAGEKIHSEIKFSADRQEMRVTTRRNPARDLPSDIAPMVEQQLGGMTLEVVYRRVDDRTSP